MRLAAATEWEAGAASYYAWDGDFSGTGVTGGGLWLLNEYVGFGPIVDVAYLSAAGDHAVNGQRYRYAFIQTFLGGVVQGRLPLGRVLPYAELALGGGLISELDSVNTQCSYNSLPGGALATGAKLELGPGLAVGIRAGARFAAGGSCTDRSGPWSFAPGPLLSLGGTFDLRW